MQGRLSNLNVRGTNPTLSSAALRVSPFEGRFQPGAIYFEPPPWVG